jgi:subtilisin family serine protease
MDYTIEDLDGQTAMISRGAAMAAQRGILVVVSAGNTGGSEWNLITSPADADGILSVGAVNLQGVPASFSSFGPTADGRVKPEVSSIGVQTVLIRSSGLISSGSGTSFSAPIIAGFATLLWQKSPALSSEELRDYIIGISDRVNSPDNQLGYGIPSIATITSVEEEVSEGISVYPVPYSIGQQLTVKSHSPILQIRITGLDGRTLLLSPQAEGQVMTIDTYGMSGFFIMEVFTRHGMYACKVVSK